jgi:predicted MFS family arabinose efflux permease
LIGTGLKHQNKVVQRKIDYLGALLLTTFTTSLLLVLSWGGNVYPWASPMVLAMAGLAALAFGLLIPCERRAEEPILPPRLFVNRVFCIAVAVIALNSLALFGAFTFLPLFFQLVLQKGASQSGLMMAPLMGGVICSSILGGRRVSRTGRYKVMTILGLMGACVSLLFIAAAARFGSGAVWIELALIAMGLGLGLVMPTLTVAIQNGVAITDLGVATSASAYCRSLGGGLGVALSGAILTASLQRGSAQEAGQGLAQIASLPPALRLQVMEVYRSSISMTFTLAAAITAVAFLVLFLLPEVALRSHRKED